MEERKAYIYAECCGGDSGGRGGVGRGAGSGEGEVEECLPCMLPAYSPFSIFKMETALVSCFCIKDV